MATVNDQAEGQSDQRRQDDEDADLAQPGLDQHMAARLGDGRAGDTADQRV